MRCERHRLITPPGNILCGIAVLLAAIACTTAAEPPGASGSPQATAGTATILIENEGSFTMSIRTDASPMRLGTVAPGGSECLLLQVLGIQRLTARPSGGGNPVVSPFFDPANARGWRWEVGTAPASGGPRLAPAERCEP